jgi:hypothetical protein
MTDLWPKMWNSPTQEPPAYVHFADIADIVSLKDKSCTNGGGYAVPSMRVLFRMLIEVVSLQSGSEILESGWKFGAAVDPDASLPECTDGHVTKTRQKPPGELLPITM